MWLIFPLVIVAAAHRFKAAFSLAYVALLGTWYAAHVALLFDPGTRALRELPIRVAFFALIGLLATALSYSLRRGRSTKGGEGDS